MSLLAGLCVAAQPNAAAPATPMVRPLLVVGFMGGRVHADNLLHKEAVIARDLQQRDGNRVQVLTYANHAGDTPFNAVLHYADANGDGVVSDSEKAAARIVIYGHSWGASETVHLADRLAALHIPVLLTVQVDSVQKRGENDEVIPSNVREAVNYFQSEGFLRGRQTIRAADPSRTRILANRQLTYRDHPVDCGQFPWFARTFMKQHIEIENDPSLWNEVEALIQSKVTP